MLRRLLSPLLLLLEGSLALNQSLALEANKTYEQVFPCMSFPNTWMMQGRNIREWHFPDDAEHHFEEVKNRTARFRTAPVHEYANFEGPWIENIWIRDFMNRPLADFHGFIPLFIQWIDTQILRRGHFDAIHNELNQLLRPNVLYLAVSQGDVGLGKIGTAHPNILVLASGGYGHVPLPLIRGERDKPDLAIPVQPPPEKYDQAIGFFGNQKQHGSTRPEMLSQISAACSELNVTLRLGQGPTWQRDMQGSKFNLAPRGYGRSSFRYAEAVQMGRMPVFLWDDVPWIPYAGTNLSADSIGFSAGLRVPGHPLREMVEKVRNMTAEQEAEKMKRLREARPHFTFAGVLRQIELFMNDPFSEKEGASSLRCTPHPRTEK